jgi:serine/threonine protein kinase/tetratricopeptide (TPR) repeat protein
VLGPLGAGGMGVVYRAEDLRLHREVAVKVLSTDLAGMPAARERFEREARLAAALNHPNICTIHDIGDHGGSPFIVMEFLEGESLAQRLRERTLPIDRVLELAIHVAEALEAAHRRGVIHRDLKPANVFVMGDGRHAKVLDFGLARLLTPPPEGADGSVTASDPSTTQTGAVSPAYVSPEQARGEAVDQRTDIFSFGALLYEMATGERAFPGATPAAVFDGILNRTPIAPSVINPQVPAGLEAAISQALAKDPSLRYQNAADLLADLRRIKHQLEGSSSPTLSYPRRPTSAWRRHVRAPSRRVVSLAALIALVLLATTLVRHARPPRPALLTERDAILIAPFENVTGDPVFDVTLSEALATQLAQSPFLEIVPIDQIRQTLRMMRRSPDERLTHDLAREVCERQGAKVMLEGQIASLGRMYVLSLEATNCAAGESVAREQAQAEGKERVLSVLGRIASSMRAKLGESLATIQKFDAPIEQATTRSLDALKAYALGVAERAKGNEVGAIALLKRAVALDPAFASAHSALSSIYGSLGETDERSTYARLAYQHRDHVSERERLYIEYQHYDAAGEEPRAIEILEVWKQLYPRDYRPANALAVSFNRIGRYDRAIEEAREAQRRNPAHPFPYSNLAYAYRGAGRLAEARETAEQAIARKTETLPLRRLLYQLALLASDPALANQQLEWGKGQMREFDLVGAQAEALAFAGRMSSARTLYSRTTDMARRQGFLHVALGYAARAAWTEALYGSRAEAVRQAQAVLSAGPTAAPRLRATAALALAGAPDAAESAVSSSPFTSSADMFVRMVYAPIAQASIRLARGRPAQAVEDLAPTQPYELGAVAALAPAFLRGRALLQLGSTQAAVQEFRTVLDHRGVDPFSPIYPVAELELARALARAGDAAGSRLAYDQFLRDWAGADPDLPVFRAARAERQRLR